MRILSILQKAIKNTRDGFHLNSPHWQNYKANLPMLPKNLFDVAFGMIISDATMYRVSKEAYIKFEQGYAQKALIDHLFNLFATYCFMTDPGIRMDISKGPRSGLVKSYWFKTFSFPCFSILWDLFYLDGKKVIIKGLVFNHINNVSLAYWVMGDDSLDGQTLQLNTQGFTKEENVIISEELNAKFDLNSRVIVHKGKYFVVQFPYTDGPKLNAIISPHMLPSFSYKVPRA
jgi:hypothetical protein